jgi:hypothetical protein
MDVDGVGFGIGNRVYGLVLGKHDYCRDTFHGQVLVREYAGNESEGD